MDFIVIGMPPTDGIGPSRNWDGCGMPGPDGQASAEFRAAADLEDSTEMHRMTPGAVLPG